MAEFLIFKMFLIRSSLSADKKLFCMVEKHATLLFYEISEHYNPLSGPVYFN